MYLSWFPCMDCARGIVQVGIKELVATKPDVSDPQWGTDFSTALQLLEECNIRIRWYEE
jgi:dCMP deaminase